MKFHTLLTTASLLALSGLSHATTTGLNTDPGGSAWDRGDANSGYAQLDAFPTFVFSNVTPTVAAGVSSAGFSQSSAAGNAMFGTGLYNVLQSVPVATDGDVLFQGNSALNFSFTGSTTFSINTLTLQMKRVTSTGGLAANFAPTISINGGAPISFNSVSTITGTGDTSGDAPGNYSVTTWTWDASLASNLETGSFTINIPSVGNVTRGIDFLAVDFASVTPVPEPGTYAMAGALVLLIGFRVYRTRRVRALRA